MNLSHLEAHSWVEIEQMVCKEINLSDFTADCGLHLPHMEHSWQPAKQNNAAFFNLELCPIPEPEPNQQK